MKMFIIYISGNTIYSIVTLATTKIFFSDKSIFLKSVVKCSYDASLSLIRLGTVDSSGQFLDYYPHALCVKANGSSCPIPVCIKMEISKLNLPPCI